MSYWQGFGRGNGRTQWKVKDRNTLDEKKEEKNDDASLFRLRRGVVLVICNVLYIYIKFYESCAEVYERGNWDIIIIHQKDAS
jgi:hypothetical protein